MANYVHICVNELKNRTLSTNLIVNNLSIKDRHISADYLVQIFLHINDRSDVLLKNKHWFIMSNLMASLLAY